MSSVCLLSIYITFFSLLPFSSIDYLMAFMLVFTAIQSRYILGYFPSVSSLWIISVGEFIEEEERFARKIAFGDFIWRRKLYRVLCSEANMDGPQWMG